MDFNSPLFKPETGFPFGKTLRSSLYVSLLGLDSLGKHHHPKTWERHQVPGVGLVGPKLLGCCCGLFAAGGSFVAFQQ